MYLLDSVFSLSYYTSVHLSEIVCISALSIGVGG